MNMEYRTNRIQNEIEILLVGPCPFKKDDIYQNLIKKLPILAIDSCVEHLEDRNLALTIGDGDSTEIEMDIKYNPIKDESDLTLGLNLLGTSPKDIKLYGFLGNRKDHELINIGEVCRYVEKSNSTAHFENLITILPKGTHSVFLNGVFSLLSISENEISLTGKCEYQLKDVQKIWPLSSRGLSNIGSGNCHITCSKAVIIYHNPCL